jgi:peptide/nickel transport system permease protein
LAYPSAAIEETVAPRRPTRPRPGRRIWSLLIHNRKAAAGVLLMAIFVIVAVFAPILSPHDPTAGLYTPMQGPSTDHLLGTTSDGKDVFSQLIWGTRQSLLIAIAVGALATVISVLVGITAAYLGGTVDHVLALVTDIFLILPALPLMIIIAAYYKGSGVGIIIAVIVITGWAYGARQLRAQALSLRNREFLESARVRGENSAYIILFELLPTMTSLIVANFLGAAVYAVLTAAGLQFIGLGNPADQSWGTMLYFAENNEALNAGAPLWAIAPGVCIALLGAAFALLNYAFDEIGNPALRSARRKRVRRAADS